MATVARRLRLRSAGPAIPLATTAPLAPLARRTTALRLLLAALLVTLAVGAVRAARSEAASARGLLPTDRSGMLVLDVSRSIKPETNRMIVGVLDQLIRARTRIGLVAFS